MNAYLITLRILHIGAGVFWAGTVILIVRFVLPTARGIGPAGGQFVGRMMGEQRLGRAAGGAAIVTIVSGALLYWRDFGAIVPSGAMMTGFAVGAVAAIALYAVSALAFAPANAKLADLGARAAQGEDVGALIAQTAAKRDRVASWMFGLVLIAVVAMAVSRYL